MMYRQPTWQTITLTAVAATVVSAMLAFARPVEIRVDGQRVASEVAPVSPVGHPDRLYVPLRVVAQALGADTVEDKESGQIAVIRGKQTLKVKVGDTHATVNGEAQELRHAPFRVRGHVMIGISEFEHAFGVHVSYNSKTAQLNVDSSGVAQPTE